SGLLEAGITAPAAGFTPRAKRGRFAMCAGPSRRSPWEWRDIEMRRNLSLIAITIFFAAATACGGGEAARADASAAKAKPAASGKTEIATLAGGCFWCTESAFDDLPGVVDVVSGYTGGSKADPTYEEVSSGGTGH